MADHQEPLKTYRGNCHCAAFVYEVTLPEIKQVTECNCSVCYKKAALWIFPEPENIKFVKGDPEELVDYSFGKKLYHHKFCSTCGIQISIVKVGQDKELETGFNVRSFQHGLVDVWKVHRNLIQGASWPPAYEPAKFTGPEPAVHVEGGKLYTGSCHCGAVRVALKSKPIDKALPDIKDCNCSSCARNGCTWIYPNKDQVVVEGEENLSVYFFAIKFGGKAFCKYCGVFVYNAIQPLPEERLEAFPAEMRDKAGGRIAEALALMPVNLRIIEGLDVNDLNVEHCDGYSIGRPWIEPYTEP
ncbi:glutathione-dependent formaldehyde-activating enzyme [Xylariomycetidae sp. FL0641]|nr:glutathione-dependent formaldehyde-activating enzyme [Xylariomycetidae sp. FL0641]